MSSNPSDQAQNPPAGNYPPPAGPPPTGEAPPAAPGAPPPAGQNAYAPPAGYPPPSGPPGAPSAYPPPPGAPPVQYGGAYGYYPPPGQYYPPPGQYPYAQPGYPGYPPPGQYPPAQYPPPSPGTSGAPPGGPPPGSPAPGATGQYPPPAGPPPAQYPGYYPGAPGTPQPPYGAPYGAPQPPYGAPYGAPGYGTPGFPPAPGVPIPVPDYNPHAGQPKDPLIYLDVAIPDPNIEAPPKGAQKVPGYDPTSDFNAIRRFNKDNWTDAQAKNLTKVILNLNPLQTDALGYHCKGELGKSLQDMIDALPLGNYGRVLHARSLGPLGYDVWLLKEATRNLGTNEMILIELILGRPAHEIRWLKTGYKLRYGKDLVDLIKSELSGTFEQLFVMALNAQKPPSTPYDAVDQAKVTADIEALNYAAKKKDELVFFDIFVNRSDRHLSAVIGGFSTQYKSLSRVVKKAFKGDVERALVYMVHRAKPKRDGRGIWQTAKLIESTMRGAGTKDAVLIYRIVRASWDPERIKAVKDAYQRRYGKPLETRMKGESSIYGPYWDALRELMGSTGK